MKRSPIRRRNPERAAKMRAKNFAPRPAVEPFCAVAWKLAAMPGRPLGWSVCWGPIDQCHIKARGMGGCNSDGATVYLCRGHHQEQEGRTAAFEAKYQIDLRAEGARQAKGLGDLMS